MDKCEKRTGWDKRKGATGNCFDLVWFGFVLLWLLMRNSSVAHASDCTIIEHPQLEGAKGKEQEEKERAPALPSES
jgi:hypothetical protein